MVFFVQAHIIIISSPTVEGPGVRLWGEALPSDNSSYPNRRPVKTNGQCHFALSQPYSSNFFFHLNTNFGHLTLNTIYLYTKPQKGGLHTLN